MREKLKILISYHGKRGSGPSYSLEWAKGLKECGCEVYAIVSKEVVNLEEWENVIVKDNLYLIDTHKDYSKISLLLKTIKLCLIGRREIKKQFKGIKFDISFHTFYCHWANLVDRWIKVDKVVAICHDPIAHTGTHFYMQYLYYRHYRKADDVFTLTKAFKKTVNEQFGTPMERIHYIPHGRMQMYNKYSQEMLETLNYKNDKYNFLFFGFIEHYKGLKVLAEAYKELSLKRNDITLTIAGNGDFSPYAKSFLNLENVNIINRYIKDEEVGALFAGPNVIVVLPYINATQSGVIPIAYEFLTPVIASDTGGLKEQLCDGKIGLLHVNGDSKDLALKMESIIENKQEWDRQTMLMKEFRIELDWKNLSERLINEIYKNSVMK
ncbi:MAG: glycosyltransferase family 4 protein [Lachnospiraceae bacterium]|nr:glycosyltransferase family 4 protein [Lachnospiraceae bacterium]